MRAGRLLSAPLAAAMLALVLVSIVRPEVPAIVGEYWRWRETVKPLQEGADPIALFETKLRSDGLRPAAAAAQIEALRRGLIAEEGEFYDAIYANGPNFSSQPNALLVEAVKERTPGKALDVGMGQGRNAVHLARLGWEVTGFDPSAVGLEQASRNAAAHGVEIRTVQAGAEYFDFGHEKWDLIAIIYPIEKVSIYRVRESLRPGGLVVVEAPHKETAAYPHHYDSNELPEIFAGFRILKYEDTRAIADWGLEAIRLVRLIAQKPM